MVEWCSPVSEDSSEDSSEDDDTPTRTRRPVVEHHDDRHPTQELSDEELLEHLGQLYETRLETLRHGSQDALDNSDRRLRELEGEYLRRYPEREVSPERVRPGS